MKILHEFFGNQLLAKIGKAIYKLFFASIEETVEADPLLAYCNHAFVLEAMRKKDLAMPRRRMKPSPYVLD